VAVVAAGVHAAGLARRVGRVAHLLDRQAVQIHAQHDGARAGRVAPGGGHEARAAHAGAHMQPRAGEELGHARGRARLLVSQLRVLVELAAQRDQLAMQVFDVGRECCHAAILLACGARRQSVTSTSSRCERLDGGPAALARAGLVVVPHSRHCQYPPDESR